MIITPFFLILLAGGIGGAVNALMTDNGFIMPKPIKNEDNYTTIVKLGFIGNIFVGAVSSVVSWGLYGSMASMNILAEYSADAVAPLTFSSLAGAILVGTSGAKWITTEVDKNLFKVAAVEAAKKTADINASQRILETNSSEKALKIARAID